MAHASDCCQTPARVMWIHNGPRYTLVTESLAVASRVHAHNAIQLTIGLDEPVRAFVAGRLLPPSAGVLIGPNVLHTVAGRVAHVFVEPLEALGRWLRGVLGERPWVALEPAVARELLAGASGAAWLHGPPFGPLDEAVDAAFGRMARAHGRNAMAPVDARVADVIATLSANLDARVPLEQLADVAHLSPSRLTHLFTSQVGMPIKQYVVWLRLIKVIASMRGRQQLGELAHASGFPDQAAFTRSYRNAWGRTPTAFRQATR